MPKDVSYSTHETPIQPPQWLTDSRLHPIDVIIWTSKQFYAQDEILNPARSLRTEIFQCINRAWSWLQDIQVLRSSASRGRWFSWFSWKLPGPAWSREICLHWYGLLWAIAKNTGQLKIVFVRNPLKVKNQKHRAFKNVVNTKRQ